MTTQWTEKFQAHSFPECFPIFQNHCTRSLGISGLLSPSWTSPSSLRPKDPAATVPLRPIFPISGAFASSGFSYCLGSQVLLNKHKKCFDGKIGVYPHKTFHIDIDPEAVPVHSRSYPVPHINLDTFKTEIQHMVQLGVLVPQGCSEWAFPSFVIPKKYGRVRSIRNLRQLNKVVKRKQYPLSIINDILRKRNGYEFFTKLDI